MYTRLNLSYRYAMKVLFRSQWNFLDKTSSWGYVLCLLCVFVMHGKGAAKWYPYMCIMDLASVGDSGRQWWSFIVHRTPQWVTQFVYFEEYVTPKTP